MLSILLTDDKVAPFEKMLHFSFSFFFFFDQRCTTARGSVRCGKTYKRGYPTPPPGQCRRTCRDSGCAMWLVANRSDLQLPIGRTKGGVIGAVGVGVNGHSRCLCCLPGGWRGW